MSLTADAIRELVELSEANTVEIGSRIFTDKQVYEVKPHSISAVNVHSLQGIVDFFDGEEGENLDVSPFDTMIQIVDPKKVEVYEAVASGVYRDREHYLTATRIHSEFPFGTWFEQQEMIINLMTMFEQTEDLKAVIRVVSGLIVSQDATVTDDGVSQEVKVRKGIGRIENVTIENPIMLEPIRTFTEVSQVSAPYVLRVRDFNGEPQIAIFEAGGGHWKNEAIARIKQWLKDRLPDAKIIG